MTADLADRLGTIAIIGGGRMGEAIVAGLVAAGFDPATIIVAAPGEPRREYLTSSYGVRCVAEGGEVVHPRTALLAVKPQVLREVAAGLAAAADFDPVRVISIAAGVTTATLTECFPGTAVIRVMPNAPLMVGAGMSAVCVASHTGGDEGDLVRGLFSLMGEAVVLDESLLNAATAISGSGPAYFALFVEELTRAGIVAGLPDDAAAMMAQQTLIGTARQLGGTDMTPAELRVAVTSPGGTTQAALEAFERDGLSGIVGAAVTAALQRAEELA
jgi:pyrroline-5-carboxylate reductase